MKEFVDQEAEESPPFVCLSKSLKSMPDRNQRPDLLVSPNSAILV